MDGHRISIQHIGVWIFIDCEMFSEQCAVLGEGVLGVVSGGGMQVVKEGSPGTGV